MGDFQIKPPISGVNVSNNILIPHIIWHNLWNLLTINLRGKSFHNSIEWSRRFFKWLSHHGCENVSDLQCSDYWKMHFVKFLPPCRDLMISPHHLEQLPHKFSPKFVPPEKIFSEKIPPPHTLGWRHHERVFRNKTENKMNWLKIKSERCF